MKPEIKIYLSIVIPIYNEAKNIPDLYEELLPVLKKLEKSYEVIFIDDGSWDDSYPILKAIQKKDPKVKLIKFRKNFGQTAALAAGFDYAKGDIIVTLDGDLQNDPRDIPPLIEKIGQGFDIVSGWRLKRKDKFLTRRLPSAIANRLISWMTKVKLHDYGCTLKAFRKDVVKNLRLYGEMHRFIPALASEIGASITEIKVNHRPRKKGKSKYTIMRTPRVILDLITVKFMLSYSTRPLQIFGFFGFITGFTGVVIGIILSYKRLILKHSIAGRPLLLLAILLTVTGIQFVTLGLLAEIMVRAYHESSAKKIYYIREIIDSDSDES
ncbi:MAG: glycosyltransferase family 2 protein [Candidatus Aminicenantes bacterium]|nr:glycosyltransferase family 2 protein [Candidatus Aminicenantes bacterium]